MSDNSISSQKKRLLSILFQNSFHYQKDKIYTLSSGKKSNYYIDAKATTLNPEGMRLIGNILYEMISPLNIDAVGGLTLGADPISFAISMVSYERGHPIKPFIVRKSAKSHGTKKWIEGNLTDNSRVIIIDDVVTTGKSTLEAVEKIKKEKVSLIKTIALIDREEGGKDAIEKEGVILEALFTRTDLMNMTKNL